jgi:hypothetical protein
VERRKGQKGRKRKERVNESMRERERASMRENVNVLRLLTAIYYKASSDANDTNKMHFRVFLDPLCAGKYEICMIKLEQTENFSSHIARDEI